MQLLFGFAALRVLVLHSNFVIADLLKDGTKNIEKLANRTTAHAPSLYGVLSACASVLQHLLQLAITARLSSATLPGSRKTPVEDCFLNRYHSLQNKSV